MIDSKTGARPCQAEGELLTASAVEPDLDSAINDLLTSHTGSKLSFAIAHPVGAIISGAVTPAGAITSAGRAETWNFLAG